MEDGQKKIWICLLVIVLTAVIVGIVYYFGAPSAESSEGFLIRMLTGRG